MSIRSVLLNLSLVVALLGASQLAASCELTNTIAKDVYAALYYKMGDKWLRVAPPTLLASKKTIMLPVDHTQSRAGQPERLYRYAVASTTHPFKEFLSDREIATLSGKEVGRHQAKATVGMLDFNAQDKPLDPRIITIQNDTRKSTNIAIYVFKDPTKPTLTLSSVIYTIASKTQKGIPIAPLGHDVVLLASENEENLKGHFESLEKSSDVQCARPYFIAQTKNDRYTLSSFFRNNILTIKNDTDSDWQIGVYRTETNNSHRLISSVVLCKAGKVITLNKNNFLKASLYYQKEKAHLTLLFDHSAKAVASLLSPAQRMTLHGGTIGTLVKELKLSQWAARSSAKVSAFVKTPADRAEKSAKKIEKRAEVTEVSPERLPAESEEKETQSTASALGVTISGAESFQITNNTSKALYVGAYKGAQKQYKRREKPIMIKAKKGNPVGFNEHERVLFSVSAIELKEELSAREYGDLNSIDPVALKIKDQDYPITKETFKAGTFDLYEVTIDNETSDAVMVARYDQIKTGVLTLKGTIQKIGAKKEDETTDDIDAKSAPERTGTAVVPNFVLPEKGSTFIGYGSEYDTFPKTVESDFVYDYERFKMSAVTDEQQKAFKVPGFFTGKCIEFFNDTEDKNLGKTPWFMIVTKNDHRQIARPNVLGFKDEKKIIPFYPEMELIIKDSYFSADDAFTPPYRVIALDTTKTYAYRASTARAVQTEQESLQLYPEKKEGVPVAAPAVKPVSRPVFKEKPLKPMKPAVQREELPFEFPITKKEEQVPTPLVKGKEVLPAVSSKDILFINETTDLIDLTFYYKSLWSIETEKERTNWVLDPAVPTKIPLPPAAMIATRYAVFSVAGEDRLPDQYSSAEFEKLIKSGRAFSVEKLGGKVKRLK